MRADKARLLRLLSLGPAVIISVAYTDPGNFGSNIAAGSNYGLKLLWVVWVSGLMAILFQYISGKMGLAGVTVPDYVFSRLEGKPLARLWRTLYFIALFIMVLATDMAEFLGIALGLHLLLGIPLQVAVWVSIIDVLILMAYANTMTRLERAIAALVSVIGLSYIYELYLVGVDLGEVASSSFTVDIASKEEALIASSIIGATVMPHAVLLHSYLSREKWGLPKKERIKEILRKHAMETFVFLFVASLINASLQIMSYYAFYKNGYKGLESMELAYETLTPLYGSMASIVFGIAILASGLSSSMVSVIAGVSLIESFMGRKFEEWKVRLAARLVNMVPLSLAIHAGWSTLDILVYSQAVLSATLPLVLIPLILAASDRRLLGDLANNRVTTLLATASTLMIIGINLLLAILE